MKPSAASPRKRRHLLKKYRSKPRSSSRTFAGTFLLLLFIPAFLHSSDVLWSRFTGKVKALNYKSGLITFQTDSGDIFSVKADKDIVIVVGKEERALPDVRIDDKITLLNIPKADVPAPAEDAPGPDGVYPPIRK